MKQKVSFKNSKKERCKRTSCITCPDCKAIDFEELKRESKTVSAQLYAKEIENYFFYYSLNEISNKIFV